MSMDWLVLRTRCQKSSRLDENKGEQEQGEQGQGEIASPQVFKARKIKSKRSCCLVQI